MSPSESSNFLQTISYLDLEDLLDTWISEKNYLTNQYETVRINKTLRDIFSYLDRIATCIADILENEKDPGLFHKSRNEVQKAINMMRKIDVFLREAFKVTDSSMNGDMIVVLKKATLQTMDTMKLVNNMRKTSEKATTLIELRELILLELTKEISECKLQFSQIKKTPAPVSLLEILPINSLSEYVSSASLLSTQELFGSNSKLLVFTETERDFYSTITGLESRLQPMQVSVEMLKYKVGDLNGQPGGFQAECEKITQDSIKLEQKWTALLSEFILVKNKTIGARIVSVCQYLNTQVLEMINEIFEDIGHGGIDQELVGPSFKTCSAAINLIRRITTSGVPGIQSCVIQYNLEISPKWEKLNEIMQNETLSISELSQTFKPAFIQPLNGNKRLLLRAIKTRKSLTPQAEVTHERRLYPTNRHSLGLGINLGLGVEPSPSVPYSISKTDRIVDLGIDSSYILKSNVQLAILQTAGDGPDEQHPSIEHFDDQLSLPNTPAMFSLQSPTEGMGGNGTTETTPFYRNGTDDQGYGSKEQLPSVLTQEEKRNLLRSLKKHDTTASRIPTMVAGYASLKLPVLRKNYRPSHGKSRIPTISSDNEVFCSPERRTTLKTPMTSTRFFGETPILKTNPTALDGLRSPPAFLIAHEMGADQRRVSGKQDSGALGDVTNVRPRIPSLNAPADKLSLSGMATPNLAFSRGSDLGVTSWRSTSPERPGSPMGSRYDDKNLTPELKSVKKPWK